MSVSRLAQSISTAPKRDGLAPGRMFTGTVTAVDTVAKTATVGGVVYPYLETPTVLAVNHKVFVMRSGVGQGIIVGRFP